MAYVPAALRVGGYTIDTSKTSHVLPFGGIASLHPGDCRRLDDGLRRLQGLGHRALAEFVLAASPDVPKLLGLLAEFTRLSPAVIAMAGADVVPALPLRIVHP